MRYVGYLGLLVGFSSIVIGFLYYVMFAGIPYQDQTPELQQRYDFHAGVAFYIEIIGVLILAIGSLLWIAGLIYKRKCEQIMMDGFSITNKVYVL